MSDDSFEYHEGLVLSEIRTLWQMYKNLKDERNHLFSTYKHLLSGENPPEYLAYYDLVHEVEMLKANITELEMENDKRRARILELEKAQDKMKAEHVEFLQNIIRFGAEVKK